MELQIPPSPSIRLLTTPRWGFQGIDKLADLFTSVSPMIYGFNNPIKFKDPTGLSGESSDCPEGQTCYMELPAFEVTDSRLPDYPTFLRQLRESSNPLSRAVGIHGQSYGINSARDFLGRGRKLHYSEGEAIKYKESEFMEGIRAMYKYGVTGSILAIAGSPILIESIAPSLMNKTALDMPLEATWQMGNSLLYNGDLSQIDMADIGFAAFGKYGFVLMATFDYNSNGEFNLLGNGKNTLQFGTDIFIGGFNKWHGDAMGAAKVEESVINFFNRFNGNLRNTVGTGIKEGVKDE